jgi:cytochrome c
MPVVPAAYLPLFTILLAAGQLLQLLWTAALVGGMLFSLVVLLQAQRHRDPLRMGCARELSRRLPANGLFGPLYWLLAAVNLAAVYSRYRPPFLTPPFLGSALVLLAGALTLLFFYRRLLHRQRSAGIPLLVGTAGLLLLLGTLVLFACGGAALLNPEYWPHLDYNPLHFLSWNALARLLLFLALALPLSGAALLSGSQSAPPDLQPYLVRRGMLLAVPGLLLLPPGVLFVLVTLPVIARTPLGALLSAAALLVALPLCLQLCHRLREGRGLAGRPLLAAVTLIVLLVGLGDVLSREQVWADGTVLARQTVSAGAEQQPAVPVAQPVGPGAQLFREHCAVCHRFDTRLVGPPLLEVLPRYRGRSDALQQFIRQPVKRDPDYPAMPALELRQEEIAALAAYLLDRLEQN